MRLMLNDKPAGMLHGQSTRKELRWSIVRSDSRKLLCDLSLNWVLSYEKWQ
jgi:hypothetical protein